MRATWIAVALGLAGCASHSTPGGDLGGMCGQPIPSTPLYESPCPSGVTGDRCYETKPPGFF